MSRDERQSKLSYLNSGLRHLPASEYQSNVSIKGRRLSLHWIFPLLLFMSGVLSLLLAFMDSDMRPALLLASGLLFSLMIVFFTLKARNARATRATLYSARDFPKFDYSERYETPESKMTAPADNGLAWHRNSARSYGRIIGKGLALDYRRMTSSLSEQEELVTLYDLIPDLEKDLNQTFLATKIPKDEWSRLVAALGGELAVTLVKQAAVEAFLELGSNWEKRPDSISVGKEIFYSNRPRAAKPRPGTRLHLDPIGFEIYCVEWAVYLGYQDAKVTRSTKDGGIDISSSSMVAQCKYQELPVGVKPIRELFGLSQAKMRKPLFFSLNGYTREAINEAEQYGVELWVVRPLEGRIERVGLVDAMNQGDYHSGPEGYSPNTAYQETQYGSNFDEDAEWRN